MRTGVPFGQDSCDFRLDVDDPGNLVQDFMILLVLVMNFVIAERILVMFMIFGWTFRMRAIDL